MKHTQMTAEPRTVLGKKVARLRHEGKLPANIYGHGVESTAITLDEHDFLLLYRHVLPTTVIDLRVDGETRPVLLAKASASPRTGQLIHVEFKQVNLREKVTASVSVVGAGASEMMERGDGILVQALDSVTVSALPDELPASIEVDLSALVDLHAAIHVSDLPVDRSKVEILTPRDEVVFTLTAPQLRDEVSEEQVEADVAADAAAEGGAAADTAAGE